MIRPMRVGMKEESGSAHRRENLELPEGPGPNQCRRGGADGQSLRRKRASAQQPPEQLRKETGVYRRRLHGGGGQREV